LSTIPDSYIPLLDRVEKPGRYVGGEMNCIVKDPARIRATFALAFPDIYDIGMSYHGFRLLYERINAREAFAAERVYAPWTDFAKELRGNNLPLLTLETHRPLRDVEIVGFTLQHELCYTTVLDMLDLGGVPIRSSERLAADPEFRTLPLVVAGGEGAYSPEPVSEFIDAFAVGDGEEIVFEILDAVAEARESGTGRLELLRRLAKIPGIYVPSFYDVEYESDGTIRRIAPREPGIPEKVTYRSYDIRRDMGAVRPVVPLIRTVQDRTVIEIRRGCVNGCRFCQAGMLNRPVRERSVDQILEIAGESIAHTGDDAISLLSLSTADYTEITSLVRRLNDTFASRRISFSLPSESIRSMLLSPQRYRRSGSPDLRSLPRRVRSDFARSSTNRWMKNASSILSKRRFAWDGERSSSTT
jgi:radical SAM superfamily enzyme YgiQ (UPF0313 family)